MTVLKAAQLAGRKRKRVNKPTISDEPDEISDKILRLETRATTSPKHYNDIAKLVALAVPTEPKVKPNTSACLAVCRVYTRLFASGQFRNVKLPTKEEKIVQQWLEEQLKKFTSYLLANLGRYPDLSLTLLLKLVQSEVCCQGHTLWATGIFIQILQRLLDPANGIEITRAAFLNNYFQKYDDVRMSALQLLPVILDQSRSHTPELVSASLQFMDVMGDPPQADSDLSGTYFTHGKLFPVGEISNMVKIAKAHRKKGQDAWLSVLGLPLSKDQRKQVLKDFVHRIVPWISVPERLMDFLTYSFNERGEMSLLALSGMFYLIQKKNLDYPLFYQKLYSLIDEGILYSKHRSRFFRLLDTFMSSTHLPAALVASFIKRLSRLALAAPPAGIVVVIPWVYNMFKRHPACTFMIHREPRGEHEKKYWEESGFDDPFDMSEANPMETSAIDSSIWELETLQSHYHPNVATLAKIISEQFTKQQYNLEDFLDYSYNSLLDAELSRELKKTPVVEYQIPKYILRNEEQGEGYFGSLLQKVLDHP